MEKKLLKYGNCELEMRLAKEEDQAGLREIWKLCFGDEDSFIDLFFQERDWFHETAVLLYQGKTASMLTMIPVAVTKETGNIIRASMIYAVATHPAHQKRGYADQLIEFANRLQLSQQIPATLLVPAGEALFRYYEKRGYTDGFYVREAILDLNEIQMLKDGIREGDSSNSRIVSDGSYCRITSAGSSKYNETRRQLLTGYAYLDYSDAEVSFQKNLNRVFDTDLLLIDADGSGGCAYYERISRDEVIIKELLMPEPCLAVAVKSIAAFVPAKRYIIRTPVHNGELLGGKVRPFGMIRINGEDDPCIGAVHAGNKDCYLGIAYD